MGELIIQTGFVNHFHWFRRNICSLINYSYTLAVLKDMYLDFCIWQSLMAVIFSFRFWEPGQWEPLVRSAKISLGLQRKSAPWAQCHRQFHWEGPSGHYGLISHGWPSALFLWVKKPSGQPISQSPLSPMLNGGGRFLLSPPTSPGAMSVGSSYENTSPPFSPLSSPSAASSGSYTSPSPSGCQDQLHTLPPVPMRSSSYNYTSQPPIPQPRTILPSYSGGNSGPKVPESPRLQRKALLEAPPSPKPSRRGLNQDSSVAKTPDSPIQTHILPSVSISTAPTDHPSVSRVPVPGSPRLAPKFFTASPSSSPSSPRTKTAIVFQDRPSSPFRSSLSQIAPWPLVPSNQLSPPSRSFQPPLDPIVHIIQGGPPHPHPRTLQPPESPRLARRNIEGRVAWGSFLLLALYSSQGGSCSTWSSTGNLADSRESIPKNGARESQTQAESRVSYRGAIQPSWVRARSPSPTSGLMGEGSGRKGSFGNSLSSAFSLGSLPGPSPRSSPRSHRKMSAGHRDLLMPHPGMRERKNSITEISDNEDDLLEYHRRQREERLREQEMERLVSEMQ